MICLECNKVVRAIVYRHLQSCCGLSVREYKKKHGVTKIADDDVLNSYACKDEKNGRWIGRKLVKSFCLDCGKQLKRRPGPKASGLCKSCVQLGERNNFYNKKHSLKAREQMKKNHYDCSGENNSFFNKTHSTDSLQLMSQSHVENWKNYSNEKRWQILINWICAGTAKHSKTSIEETINSVLLFLGLKEVDDYKRNTQIGKYNVDFLVYKRLIIECYGDYWHKNPKYHNSSNDEVKRLKDLERARYLESKGYKFLYFWEDEIKNDIKSVTDKMIMFLESEK